MTHRRTALTSVDELVDIATGYMAAKQLFAAVEVGLFPALADGPRTAAELSETLGVPERSVRILADSMNALGVLEREHGMYRNGRIAADYLQGDGALDLGPFFSFLDAVSYEQWLQFGTSVRTAEAGVLDLEGKDLGMLGRGIGAFQTLHGRGFAEAVDVSGFRRMLDLGGQSPSFAVEALRANPELSAVFVYTESETGMIQAAVDAAGVADRVRIEPADTVAATPAGPFDLVLVQHCIHRFTPDQNRTILAHARAAAAPGATLVVVDFVLDDEPRQRLVDAVHAAEYLVIDATVAYPVAEIAQWLDAAGWALRESVDLPGSPRALVAQAV